MPAPVSIPAFGASDEVFELSWELFGEFCRVLALNVAREYEPEVVIGIAKAGVIPGAVIASILQADFFSMKISRRSGGARTRERPELFSTAPPQASGKRVLLVDELTTSGDTLRIALAEIRNVAPAEVRTATSFARSGGYRPDYVALETDSLIVYPWDRQVLRDGELVAPPEYAAALAR